MTAIVGIRCTDGVVIGADSSVTFTSAQSKIIEQPTKNKIELIENRIIVAGSGYVGHNQRFVRDIQNLWKEKKLSNLDKMDFAKKLSAAFIKDLRETHVNPLDYWALVAFEAENQPVLCEFPSSAAFQPEIKDPDNIWFVSGGIGQMLTDPFLAFLRSVFREDGPPKLNGGILMALWALQHACDLNTGGIKEPITIAILRYDKKSKHYVTQKIPQEHWGKAAGKEGQGALSMLVIMRDHMKKFNEIMAGDVDINIPKL